jgi:glycosyltransferase involved in cell wall biosynthesis
MRQNLHVIHLLGHLRLGAGRFIADVAISQRRRGDQVTVAVSPDLDAHWRSDPALVAELTAAAVRVLTPGDLFHRDLAGLRSAAATLTAVFPFADSSVALGAGVVAHAHTGPAAAAARWAGAPTVVVTCHGWDLARPPACDLQDALAFSLCDGITSPSRHWADRLASTMGIEDVEVVPVGLDLARCPRLVRRRLLPRDTVRLVTVCELTRRKGVDVLLDALSLVEAPCGIELHVIGDGDDAPALRARAEALPAAAARVVFHGALEAPYPALAHADLFVLASRSDNLPVAIIEAMLAGLPVIGTRVGGIPELVEDSGCGIVVPADDARSLAEALREMIGNGRESLAGLGARGEMFARRRFAIEEVVDQFDQVYASAQARRRR